MILIHTWYHRRYNFDLIVKNIYIWFSNCRYQYFSKIDEIDLTISMMILLWSDVGIFKIFFHKEMKIIEFWSFIFYEEILLKIIYYYKSSVKIW